MPRLHNAFRTILVAVALIGLAAPVLAQSGRISGQITDEDEAPIAGATVRAENPSANPPMRETTTDDDGRFSMIGFVSGQWRVSVEAEGYSPDFGSLNVTQSSAPPANFQLAKVRHALVQALGEEAMEGLDPDAIEQELEAADAAFNARNWDAAIAGYQSLLDKLPQLTNLHSQIGQSHRAAGNYPEALAAFEARLAEEPDNEGVKADIARTRLAMGDLDAASELEATASGLDASKEDLYNLGELEFAKGDVDAAAGWYEKAAMVDPNWAKPFFKLALVALNKGDMDTAKAHFQKVVDLEPNSEEGSQATATLAALP
jgi:tetratricopeptide (TPR) repeat protein